MDAHELNYILTKAITIAAEAYRYKATLDFIGIICFLITLIVIIGFISFLIVRSSR